MPSRSLGQALAGGRREVVLLSFLDAGVDHAARLGSGARRNADDKLLALTFAAGTQTVAGICTCQVAVDVGIRTQFLNELNFDRNGVFSFKL